MNLEKIQCYLFRNYNLPAGVQSHYMGSGDHQFWEAIRASSAAPGYYEECKLGGHIHQVQPGSTHFRSVQLNTSVGRGMMAASKQFLTSVGQWCPGIGFTRLIALETASSGTAILCCLQDDMSAGWHVLMSACWRVLMSASACLQDDMSWCLPISLSACVCCRVLMPVCLLACLDTCLLACLDVCLSVCCCVLMSAYLPVGVSWCLPVCLSACLDLCLSAC